MRFVTMTLDEMRRDAENIIAAINESSVKERNKQIAIASLRGESSSSIARRFSIGAQRINQLVHVSAMKAIRERDDKLSDHAKISSLSVRAKNALRNLGVKSDDDVVSLLEKECGIKKLRDSGNFGKKSLAEILEVFGLVYPEKSPMEITEAQYRYALKIVEMYESKLGDCIFDKPN